VVGDDDDTPAHPERVTKVRTGASEIRIQTGDPGGKIAKYGGIR
jgi:hypothetical protein